MAGRGCVHMASDYHLKLQSNRHLDRTSMPPFVFCSIPFSSRLSILLFFCSVTYGFCVWWSSVAVLSPQ